MTSFSFFHLVVRTALGRQWAPVVLLLALGFPAVNAVEPTAASKTRVPPPAVRGIVKDGDQLAQAGRPPSVTACVSCHGAKGEGVGAFPPLAGTGFSYLEAQLVAFADGRRQNAVMGPIAKGLSPEERTSAAAYFSGLPARLRPIAAPPPAANDAGAWLAQRGRWADQLPACAQCHGPAGEGVGSHFPPIALLPADYLQAQIRAWKEGTRPPGPLGVMRDLARKLSTEDVQAISAYYTQLHARPPLAATATRTPQGAR